MNKKRMHWLTLVTAVACSLIIGMYISVDNNLFDTDRYNKNPDVSSKIIGSNYSMRFESRGKYKDFKHLASFSDLVVEGYVMNEAVIDTFGLDGMPVALKEKLERERLSNTVSPSAIREDFDSNSYIASNSELDEQNKKERQDRLEQVKLLLEMNSDDVSVSTIKVTNLIYGKLETEEILFVQEGRPNRDIRETKVRPNEDTVFMLREINFKGQKAYMSVSRELGLFKVNGDSITAYGAEQIVARYDGKPKRTLIEDVLSSKEKTKNESFQDKMNKFVK